MQIMLSSLPSTGTSRPPAGPRYCGGSGWEFVQSRQNAGENHYSARGICVLRSPMSAGFCVDVVLVRVTTSLVFLAQFTHVTDVAMHGDPHGHFLTPPFLLLYPASMSKVTVGVDEAAPQCASTRTILAASTV